MLEPIMPWSKELPAECYSKRRQWTAAHNLAGSGGFDVYEWYSQVPEEMLKEDKFLKLASHKGEDVASEPVQNIVEEIIANAQATAPKLLVGSAENYCRMMIDTYSNDYLSKVFDTKHGAGSSEYIVEAFRYYSENNCTENN